MTAAAETGAVEPPAESTLTDTFALLDELVRLRDRAGELVAVLSGLTGLTPGEVVVLRGVAAGLEHERPLARATAQTGASAGATVRHLEDRDLLRRRGEPAARGAGRAALGLTAAGQAALEQAEALEIRLTAALLARLSPGDRAQVQGVVAALAEAVGSLPLPAGSPPGLPTTTAPTPTRAIG